jgi:hypothetical protein
LDFENFLSPAVGLVVGDSRESHLFIIVDSLANICLFIVTSPSHLMLRISSLSNNPYLYAVDSLSTLNMVGLRQRIASDLTGGISPDVLLSAALENAAYKVIAGLQVSAGNKKKPVPIVCHVPFSDKACVV